VTLPAFKAGDSVLRGPNGGFDSHTLPPTQAAMKRRKTKFDAAREARRRARVSGAKPGATKVIEDKRKRAAKHKKRWIEKELE
jgi:hypothetical protein